MSTVNQESQLGRRAVSVVKEQVSSAANWTGILPVEFDYFELIFQGLTPATDNVALFCRVRDAGDAAVSSGASDYAWAYSSQLAGTGAVDASDASDSEIQLALAVGSDTSEDCSGRILICDHADQATDATQRYTKMKFGTTVTNATPGYVDYTGSGWRLEASRSDQIQLLFASGNIESGVIELVGYTAR